MFGFWENDTISIEEGMWCFPWTLIFLLFSSWVLILCFFCSLLLYFFKFLINIRYFKTFQVKNWEERMTSNRELCRALWTIPCQCTNIQEDYTNLEWVICWSVQHWVQQSHYLFKWYRQKKIETIDDAISGWQWLNTRSWPEWRHHLDTASGQCI